MAEDINDLRSNVEADDAAIDARLKDFEETQAKYGGLGNEALAGAAGIARGIGATPLLTKTGLVSPETLGGLEKANPIATEVGKFAGGAGLLAATGGASSIAGPLAAGAIEGGVLGGINAIDDYGMGDPNLNAQKIMTHVGLGAALGLGGSALMEGAKVALPAAANELKASLGKLKTTVLGDEATQGLLQKTAPDWAAALNQGIKDGAAGLNGAKIKVRDLMSNLKDIQNTGSKAASDLYDIATPSKMKSALESMDIIEAKNAGGKTLSDSINALESSPLSSSKSSEMINKEIFEVHKKINQADTSYEVQNALSDFAKKIDQKKIIKFDTLPTAGQLTDHEALMAVRNIVRGDLSNPEVWGEAAGHYGQLNKDYSAFKTAQTNFRKSFMTKEMGPKGTRYSIDPKKVNSFFNNFDSVGNDLKKEHLNNFISQVDNLSKASENFHEFVKGDDSISSHIENLAKKNQELAQVAQAMSNKGAGGINTATAALAGAGTMAHPIIGGAILMADRAVKAAANPYELGNKLGSTFFKLKAASEAIQKVTDHIDSGAKSIFSGNTTRSITSNLAASSDRAYEKHADRIQELANDPQKLADHLEKTTAGTYEAMPNISAGLHSNLLNGILFLNKKRPRPANELLLNSIWKPTRSQKVKFNRYFGAVNDPISVLKQIKNGSLSSEAMEALETVHPELLQEMREKVASNINPKKASTLNYSTKIALSKFLGQPMESSMLPQVALANQAALGSVTQSQKPQQPTGGGKSTLGGLKELGVSNRMTTATQDLDKNRV